MKTYNKIFNAFNKLIQTKSFDDITVLEICQKANVSTSSFYRHYKDKYDVMNDNYKRILDQYINSKQNHNYEDVFINLFTMSKELHYLKNAFDYTGINVLIIPLLRCVKQKTSTLKIKIFFYWMSFVVVLQSCINTIF